MARSLPQVTLTDDEIVTRRVDGRADFDVEHLAGGQNSQNNQDSEQHFQKNMRKPS